MTSNPKRILVIEDDQQLRKLFKKKLAPLGYIVNEASNGIEGLSSYRENKQDLIITDLVMPEKEGVETIIELKMEFPEIKIIAVSGGGKNDPSRYLDIAKKLGAQKTFAKPFEWVEMIEAIHALI